MSKIKYRLKEDFGDKKAGHIFEMNGDLFVAYYKNTRVLLDPYNSDILEQVKDEPLFYTNEDEVYYDGKREPVYLEDKDIWSLNMKPDSSFYKFYNNYQISIDNWIYGDLETTIKYIKYFKSKKACEDYIKLQQAIKDSGLKIGDLFGGQDIKYRSTDWKDGQWSTSLGKYNIHGFIMYEDIPCAYCTTTLHKKNKFLVPLKQYNKPKLLFGDKEVTLNRLVGEGKDSRIAIIEFGGDTCTYQYAKEFRDAITTIQNFKFGSKSYENFWDKANSFSPIKIGCTTGTLEQIDNILKACEELLKEK